MATPVAATLASRVIARRAGASSRRRRRGRRPLRVAAAVAEDAAASDADGAKKNDDDADPTRNQHLPPPARRTPRGVPPPITVAMKEWGAIVAALEAGEQTIVFRKGGLRDGDGGFELVARHFALFPTTYHPSERITEATPLRARARAFMETPTPDMKNGDAVPVTLIAECTGAWVTKDASVFEKLAAHHAWTPELLSARMKWKPEAPITILELRVKKLADEDAALTTLPPDVERYGGCRSWIDLPYAIRRVLFSFSRRSPYDRVGAVNAVP